MNAPTNAAVNDRASTDSANSAHSTMARPDSHEDRPLTMMSSSVATHVASLYRVEPGSIFIGGEAAAPDHVWVRADIRSGRTNEQKAKILRRSMRETSETLGISEQSVWVYISDIPAQGVLEFGNVLPEPGGEEQWLASLPSTLREKLMRSA